MKVLKILLIILLGIVLLVGVDFGLGFIVGFDEFTYCEEYTPPKTYYVYKSKISGINYTKIYHSCSYVGCEGKYSYSIHFSSYFDYLPGTSLCENE